MAMTPVPSAPETAEDRSEQCHSASLADLQVSDSPSAHNDAEAEVPLEADRKRGSFSSFKLNKVTLQQLWESARTWFSNPFNVGLLIWIIAVAVSGAIFFMVMVGMLNNAIPNQSNRQIWLEASNQVLNALFTLWCLLVQPWRIMYAVWVYRWTEKDKGNLRTVFSRGGPNFPLPNERRHMIMVVVLLNLNCLFQYCLAGVMWGVIAQSRPAVAVGCLLGLAFGCAAAAGLYCIFSPLGRPQPPDAKMTLNKEELRQIYGACEGIDDNKRATVEVVGGDSSIAKPWNDAESSTVGALPEAQSHPLGQSNDSKKIRSGDSIITVPVGIDLGWKGSLFEFFEDWRSSVGVLLCCCCSFGRNLEAAGFGSKYLHAIMLIIFLAAPFLICEFAALRVEDMNMRAALVFSGIILSYFGLLYGGYWRNQLVKTFRLPTTKIFNVKCGLAGDFLLWLTCSPCALCQELRTVRAYGLHVDFLPTKAKLQENTGNHASFPPTPTTAEDAQICDLQESWPQNDENHQGQQSSPLSTPEDMSMTK